MLLKPTALNVSSIAGLGSAFTTCSMTSHYSLSLSIIFIGWQSISLITIKACLTHSLHQIPPLATMLMLSEESDSYHTDKSNSSDISSCDSELPQVTHLWTSQLCSCELHNVHTPSDDTSSPSHLASRFLRRCNLATRGWQWSTRICQQSTRAEGLCPVCKDHSFLVI